MSEETCVKLLDAQECDFERLIKHIYEEMDQRLRRGEYAIKNGNEIMVRIPRDAYVPHHWSSVAEPLVDLIQKRTKGEVTAYPVYDFRTVDPFGIVISKAKSGSKESEVEDQSNPNGSFSFKYLTRRSLVEKFTNEKDNIADEILETARMICDLIDQKFHSGRYRKEENAIEFEITEVEVPINEVKIPFRIAQCVLCELKRQLYDANWSICYNYRVVGGGLGKFVFTIEYTPTITPLK